MEIGQVFEDLNCPHSCFRFHLDYVEIVPAFPFFETGTGTDYQCISSRISYGFVGWFVQMAVQNHIQISGQFVAADLVFGMETGKGMMEKSYR